MITGSALVRIVGHVLRRQPEALFLALLLLLSGLGHFFGTPLPNPVQALVPRPLVTLWYAELLIGGALRLVGLLIDAPKLSLAGATFLATANLVYASAVVYVNGPGSVFVAVVTYALAGTYLLVAVTYVGDVIRSRGQGPTL